jgi:hypothetical protein
MNDTLRILFGQVTFISLAMISGGATLAAAGGAPPLPPNVAAGVRVERWYTYYSPYNPTPAPAPALTLLQKYTQASTPADMNSFIAAEFNRLRQILSSPQQVVLRSWTISTKNCASGLPVVLVCQVRGAASNETRISPLLPETMFMQNAVDAFAPQAAGVPLVLKFQKELTVAGVQPLTFDGTYHQSYQALNSVLSEEYWNAALSSLGAYYWPPFAAAMDFVIAREIARITVLPQPTTAASREAAWDTAARDLIMRANNNVVDTTVLAGVLTQAQAHNDASTFGYNDVGDVGIVLSGISP